MRALGRSRVVFVIWVLIACPAISWAVAAGLRGPSLPDLGRGGFAGVFIMVPAALACTTGVVSRRSTKETVLAAIGAATIAGDSFILLLVILLLRLPDDFFQ